MERAPALEVKDTVSARFGHSDVVFCLFLVKGIACQSSVVMLKEVPLHAPIT